MTNKKLVVFLALDLLLVLSVIYFDQINSVTNSPERLDVLVVDLSVSRSTRTSKPRPTSSKNSNADFDLLEAKHKDWWIVNEELLQYGTIVSVDEQNRLEVESMAMSPSGNLDQEAQFLRCLIQINSQQTLVLNVTEVKKLWVHHIKCRVSLDQHLAIENRTILVSIMDSRSRKLTFMAKRAEFFNRTRPKERAFMNCACAVRHLTRRVFEDVLVWARMNLAIGVKKLEIYSTDYQSGYLKEIESKFAEFVHTFEYETNSTLICMNSNVADLQSCSAKLAGLFHSRIIHQVTAMNNCFLNAKYKYLYMSNYDIDEFILPRSLNMYEQSKVELKTGRKYDIFAWIERLQQRHGKSVGVFFLANFLHLPKLNDFGNLSALKLKSQDLTWAETVHLKLLRRLKSQTDSRTEAITHRNKLEPKWLNPVVGLSKIGGKSVFNTDLVLAVQHHDAHTVVNECVQVRVRIDQAGVSHFRDDDYEYRPESEAAHMFWVDSIRHWFVDVELFNFITWLFFFSQ
jgi:hypothetical protein